MSCRLAMVLIIVKTLVCTRAIKGFYYDERLCRRAKVLVDRVENLERWLESLERLCENLGGLEMGQAGGFGLLARPPFVPARLVALGDELQRLVEAGHVNGGGAGGRGSGTLWALAIISFCCAVVASTSALAIAPWLPVLRCSSMKASIFTLSAAASRVRGTMAGFSASATASTSSLTTFNLETAVDRFP